MVELICGIDEAGRGPVIGPMVMAGVLINKEGERKLKDLGVKDSKFLSAAKREELFDKIKEVCNAYEVVVVTPQEIDRAILSSSSNLNWLEAETSAKIINKLNPQKAIVDCPSPNVAAYQRFLLSKITQQVALVAEHKADANYVVVGAASILAKVTRDRHIEDLKKSVGHDFGSGYLTDEKTQSFLQEHFATYPQLFRKSWSSYQNLAESRKQRRLGDF